VVFNDEWGGGVAHGCDGAEDMRGNGWMYRVVEPGQPIGPAVGRFMIPRAQPANEACTIHNSNFIPVKRDYFLVSAWYQGGTNVTDWSDPTAPVELAFYEPTIDLPQRTDAWSSYWYNGFIYTNDGLRGGGAFRTDSRGIDVFELLNDRGRPFKARRLHHMNPQDAVGRSSPGLRPTNSTAHRGGCPLGDRPTGGRVGPASAWPWRKRARSRSRSGSPARTPRAVRSWCPRGDSNTRHAV
jgi:hypothetical protein